MTFKQLVNESHKISVLREGSAPKIVHGWNNEVIDFLQSKIQVEYPYVNRDAFKSEIQKLASAIVKELNK